MAEVGADDDGLAKDVLDAPLCSSFNCKSDVLRERLLSSNANVSIVSIEDATYKGANETGLRNGVEVAEFVCDEGVEFNELPVVLPVILARDATAAAIAAGDI